MRDGGNTILDAVGRTPLVRLHRVGAELPAALYGKVEFVNPAGSVKDRVAVAMIAQGERDGLLRPGSTIIEATSGNTGAGLAMAAAVKGYRCICVVPDDTSPDTLRLLQAFGAETVLTPSTAPPHSPEGYAGVGERLLNEIPEAWRPDAFGNRSNPQCHFETTGREIWEQTEGRVTVFVAGVGTGGTISGVGAYLKERNPRVAVVAVDSEMSVFSRVGRPPSPLEEQEEVQLPQVLNTQVIDEWVRVSDKEAFLTARKLARQEGLLVGGLSGSVLVAGLQVARGRGPQDVIVLLFPDGGRDDLGRIYNDAWMIEHGYLAGATQVRTVDDVLELRGPRPLICVAPDDTAETAIERLRKHDISQMPVIDGGKPVGSIREITVARLLHDQRDPESVAVREIMARPLPQVEHTTDISDVYRLLLSGHSGVMVTRGGVIAGIVTRIDLVNFWEATRTK